MFWTGRAGLLLLVLIADVGVGSPLAATGTDDGVDEAPVVEDPLLGATPRSLLLLGLLDLGRLTLDLTGTRKTSVNLTCGRKHADVSDYAISGVCH